MKNSFYSEKELIKLGLKTYGKNCYISRFANFYNPDLIRIGNNVRIDDFCILSGNILIGSYVHISAYSALYGSNGIEIGDFSGLSPRTAIFSATDDFSGKYMINPLIPSEFRNVTGGFVHIGKYVQLGANTIVIPPCLNIGDGTVTGAFTYVNKNLESWKIYIGIPVKIFGKRSKDLLIYEKNIK